MFYVYILYSYTRNKFYVGHTSNINDRLNRHNSGRSKATKSGKPWVLVYKESFQTKSDAYGRETQIKAWKSRKMIKQLINKD